jgi:hypothetical protein
MMIGTFHYDRRGDSYTGDITTLALQRSHVEFRRNSDKRGERSKRLAAEQQAQTASMRDPLTQ